jgi:hypothetical protein
MGGAVDAAADTEFRDFMATRWPGLVRLGRLTQPMFSVPDGVHLVTVTPGVASLRLDLSSGQHLRVVTRAGYGGQRFYAFVLPHGTGVVGWTAYGADGRVLGSGPGATAG